MADWTSIAIADEGDLVGDAVSLSGKLSCEVSVTAVEDNTGACDGDLLVYLLRDTNATNYEDFTADDDNDAPALVAVIDAVQNKTKRKTFSFDAVRVGSFKIALDNDAGQELATTVKYRTSTMAYAQGVQSVTWGSWAAYTYTP